MAKVWLATALIAGIALNVAIPRTALAIEGESTDKKKMHGTQGHGGGGGAGAPLTNPKQQKKQKMLNPQPEPPGRR